MRWCAAGHAFLHKTADLTTWGTLSLSLLNAVDEHNAPLNATTGQYQPRVLNTSLSVLSRDGKCIKVAVTTEPLDFGSSVEFLGILLTIIRSAAAPSQRRAVSSAQTFYPDSSGPGVLLVSSATASTPTDPGPLLSVDDFEPPTIIGCPVDLDSPVDATGTANVTWTAPTASDNIQVLSLSSTHEPGTLFDLRASPYTVTYTATDVGGLQATCSFVVKLVYASTSVVPWALKIPTL
eukprot:m.906592 g.906592  ORF g.906592 m.906592 type:complete len:236 (+) comp60078_c0_seq11:1653-2360(+)